MTKQHETPSQRKRRKRNAARERAQGPLLQRKVRRNALARAIRNKVF